MAALALIAVLIGFLVVSIATIWMIVNAFRVSALWGLLVFLFSPAWIVFAFKHWDMARRPLCATLLGIALCAGPFLIMPAETRADWMRQAAECNVGKSGPGMAKSKSDEPKKPASLPPMFEAQKKMELQIKLVALQKRENELLERKAGLDPKDRQGAIALTAEIKKYNDDLKPLLQQMRDRGMVAAQ